MRIKLPSSSILTNPVGFTDLTNITNPEKPKEDLKLNTALWYPVIIDSFLVMGLGLWENGFITHFKGTGVGVLFGTAVCMVHKYDALAEIATNDRNDILNPFILAGSLVIGAELGIQRGGAWPNGAAVGALFGGAAMLLNEYAGISDYVTKLIGDSEHEDL